jgi:hypothetical protein
MWNVTIISDGTECDSSIVHINLPIKIPLIAGLTSRKCEGSDEKDNIQSYLIKHYISLWELVAWPAKSRSIFAPLSEMVHGHFEDGCRNRIFWSNSWWSWLAFRPINEIRSVFTICQNDEQNAGSCIFNISFELPYAEITIVFFHLYRNRTSPTIISHLFTSTKMMGLRAVALRWKKLDVFEAWPQYLRVDYFLFRRYLKIMWRIFRETRAPSITIFCHYVCDRANMSADLALVVTSVVRKLEFVWGDRRSVP